ncbi:hypothetical protein GCM10027589_04480 [Actinocorallia lasiicapitis]
MATATSRCCACGARLSAYNQNAVCGVCERASRPELQQTEAPHPVRPAETQRDAARTPVGERGVDRFHQPQPGEMTTGLGLRAFHGPHVPSRRHAAETIDWHRVHTPAEGRLLDSTCSCRSPVWELWAHGGQRFIRRTGNNQAHETHPMRTSYADDLWQRLVRGEAR